MRFLIVGPGAMGCLFAARLKKAGNEVTLLDYRQDRADFLNKKGITVEGVSGEYRANVTSITEKLSDEVDVALMCVKANQTKAAAERVKDLAGLASHVLTVQNGLGNVETLGAILGKEAVLGGVTAEGATLLGVGHVRHAGRGETIIGPKGEAEGPVSEIVSVFKEAGFDTRVVDNVDDLIWGKLVINVGINALTAITRLKNGRLPEVKGSRSVLEEAVREAVAVTEAKGIHLPYPDPLERVLEVCRATAGNIASMLQDVLNRRVTEVEHINGAIVREGEILGIPTPVNRTLAGIVQVLQETYDEQLWTMESKNG